MGKILPIILILVGLAGGVGAGLMLRPAADAEPDSQQIDGYETASDQGTPDSAAADYPDSDSAASSSGGDYEGGGKDDPYAPSIEYVALQRQLIVPLVEGDRVGALIVLSLSIEATGGNIELIYDREPKLRDEFLQVLFRHANTGGFDGVFTSGEAMSDLKSALNAAAINVLGPIAQQVLVTEILRQEI